MVGVKELLFGKSKTDQLLEMIREDRVLASQRDQETLKMMAEMLKSVSSQSNVFSEYLKMITSVGKPEVRIMDDEDEMRFESLRKLKQKKVDDGMHLSTPSEGDLLKMFDELRTGLV